PDACPDPAGRHPRASLRRRHGMRNAGAEGGSEHVSVEGSQGADSAGGATDTFLSPGSSTRFCLGGNVETDRAAGARILLQLALIARHDGRYGYASRPVILQDSPEAHLIERYVRYEARL